MSKILFLLPTYIFFFLFYNANASDLSEIEKEALIAVVKGPKWFANFCADHQLTIEQHNKVLGQKYKTFLGTLYAMQEKWDCEEILFNNHLDNNVEQEIEKRLNICNIQRKNMLILYEYLFQLYVQANAEEIDPRLAQQLQAIVDEKPNFGYATKRDFDILSTIKKLAEFWTDFFNKWVTSHGKGIDFSLNLANFDALVKSYNINFNKSYYNASSKRPMCKGIMLEKDSEFINSYGEWRKRFDEYMGGMDNAKNGPAQIKQPFYGIAQAIDDSAFLARIKGEIGFDKLCDKLAEKNLLRHIEWATKKLGENPSLEETKKYLAQQYEIRLGLLHLWREKWDCNQMINEGWSCEKYREYVDLLYDHLLGTYDEVLAQRFANVRPNFNLGTDGLTIVSLIDVMNRLGTISTFLFDSKYAENYKFNFDYFLKRHFPEPNLTKEQGESSSSSPSSTAQPLQKNTADYIAVQQAFDHLLRTMADTVMREKISHYEANGPTWSWLVGLKVDDEALFLLFLTDRTKFKKHCADLQGSLDEKTEYLERQFAAYLGIVHLMRQKWDCSDVDEKNYKKERCKEFRKYLDILYEYLFRVYVKTKHSRLAPHTPSVRPKFQLDKQIRTASMVSVVESLCPIWAFFFDSTFREQFKYKLDNLFNDKSYQKPTLSNNQDCKQMINPPQQQQQKIEETTAGKEGMVRQQKIEQKTAGKGLMGFKQRFGFNGFKIKSPLKKPINADEKGVPTTDSSPVSSSAAANAVVDEGAAMMDNSSSSAIESARNEFDGMLEGMTSAAKEEASTGKEGFFAENKQLLQWLLD